jgi:hypothetical protein
MFDLTCRSLVSDCTKYAAVTSIRDTSQLHLFGTGRDDASRFYVRVTDNFVALTDDRSKSTKVAFYKKSGSMSVALYTEFSETDYSSAVLSRELWLVGSLPDFKECGVWVTHVSVAMILFDIQCALRLFSMAPVTDELVFENDKRDPRRLSLKCEKTNVSFPFRVTCATFVPVSRGCVLAIHDVPQRVEPSVFRTESVDVTSMGRCRDSPYRFCSRITIGSIDELCAYLQCADLPDTAELLMTICSKHGTIRVIPVAQAYRPRFEATLMCKAPELALVQRSPKRHRDTQD